MIGIRHRIFLLLCFCMFLGSCNTRSPHAVKLVLIISVDQLPSSYLERFQPFFNGGIKKLLDDGAVFTQAAYRHADTATCPGHAVIATGVHPSKHGIISNWWFDRKHQKEHYCAYDEVYGLSPKQLLVKGLPDWIHEERSNSKVFSVSGKDRAAIMLGGKTADAAFWYDKKSGTFTSSPYYHRRSPRWLRLYNDQKPADSYFGEFWNPLPVSTTLAHFASIEPADYGMFPRNFPHIPGAASTIPDEKFYDALFATPFMDYLTLDFAKALIREESLGQDATVDYLGISFSALDPIGHEYGPDSFEVLDTVRRLDSILDNLFTYLDESIGLQHVLIVLSSDHGVQHFPELQKKRGIDAHRQDAHDVRCMQNAGKQLRKLHGDLPLFSHDLYFNAKVLRHAGLKEESLEQELAELIESCPMIEKAWTWHELKNQRAKDASPFEDQFIYSFYPERSGNITLQLKRDHLHTLQSGTGHGSPYDYDTRVPLIFLGPGVLSAHFPQQSSPLDIAPTVAGMLGIQFPKDLDGINRAEHIVSTEDIGLQ